MKVKTYIRRGFLFVLAAGFMLAGKTLPVQAAEKVALNASVFKDENLLNAVKQYDTDGDGYLDKSEIAFVTELNVWENVADASGLEKLLNLRDVILNYSGSSIELGKNTKYITLRMNASSIVVDAPGAEHVSVSTDVTSDYDFETGNLVTKYSSCHSVDVSKCGKLTDLRLFARGMTTFKLPKDGGNVEQIRISDSSITSLKVPSAKKLTYLSVFSNEKITSIDTRNASNLKTLYMTDNPKLNSLYLNKNKKLEKIVCAETSVDKLDISENKHLEFLSCPYNELKSLDCSKNVMLTAVQCYDNKLTSLNVKKSARIEEVSCANNKIKSLDLSQNKQLKTVFCYGNPLKSIYVKDKKNILKKVSITPIIESVKVSTERNSYGLRSLTVKLKKNNKINKCYVFVKPEEAFNYAYEKEQNMPKVSIDSISAGTYSIQAVSGVPYKGATVYAKDSVYKDKVTVEQ